MEMMKSKKGAIAMAANKERCLICRVRFWSEERLMFLATCYHIICTNCFHRNFRKVDGVKSNCPSCSIEFENKDVVRIRDKEVIWVSGVKEYSRYMKLFNLLNLEDAVCLNRRSIPANVYEEHNLFGDVTINQYNNFINGLRLSTFNLPVWTTVGSIPSISPEYLNLQFGLHEQYVAVPGDGGIYYYPIFPSDNSFRLYERSVDAYENFRFPIRQTRDYIYDYFSVHGQSGHFAWSRDHVVKQFPVSILETKTPTYSLSGMVRNLCRNGALKMFHQSAYPPPFPRNILQYPPAPEGIFWEDGRRYYPTNKDLGAPFRQTIVAQHYPPTVDDPTFMEYPILNLSAMTCHEKQDVWETINNSNTTYHIAGKNYNQVYRWFDVFFQYVPAIFDDEGELIRPGKYCYYYLISDMGLVQPNCGLDRTFHSSDDLLFSINNEIRLFKLIYC